MDKTKKSRQKIFNLLLLLKGMLFLSPMVVIPLIFLFGSSITLRRVMILGILSILWIVALTVTIAFLSKRHKIRTEQVLSGKYWAQWEYAMEPNSIEKVYLGPLGICWLGKSPVLLDFGDELLNVSILENDDKPISIQFEYLAKRVSPISFSLDSIGDYLISLSNLTPVAHPRFTAISIPEGHEVDAEKLAERFQSELQGLPFGSFVDRWLGFLVYLSSTILYAVLALILLSPPLSP